MKAQTPESAAARIASAPAHYGSLIQAEPKRFAVVRGARTVREAEAYLPSNYSLMESFEVESQKSPHANVNKSIKPELVIVIGGYDHLGWTLHDYVIPRLASGSIACEEIKAITDPTPADNLAGYYGIDPSDMPPDEVEYDTNDSSDLDPPEDA